jgi:UDPglucose 6-dehydrogenase
MRTSRVAVVGTGYVGTVVAACFARLGHHVVGIENDPTRLAQLQDGRAPFHEPGLDKLVRSCLDSNHLRFTADYRDGVADADAVFLCVGTASLPDGGSDLSALRNATLSVATAIDRPVTVVIKSTIPIGGTQIVPKILRDTLFQRGLRTDELVTLVHNPEFLREGSAITDFLYPDRVVLGGDNASALNLISALYQPILEQSFDGGDPMRRPSLICTDLATAEMIKYASNAFLATKISFINELANICDLVGGDVSEVATGMGLDRRIGAEFLAAGLGWGGSCFGKDLSALVKTARELGYEPELLTATVRVNDRQQEAVLGKLSRHFTCLTGRRIGLLGLTFKPGTDDLRSSPAVALARTMIAMGAEVVAYDPMISAMPGSSGLAVASDPYQMADGADAMVLATDWPDFLLLDLSELQNRMRGNLFVDGRNFFEHSTMAAAGFDYEAVGRTKADIETKTRTHALDGEP